MVWNLFLHTVIGLLGNSIFTISFHGILWCLLVTLAVQGIDMARIYRQQKRRVEQTSLEHIREEKMRNFQRRAPIILTQIYIGKVLLYGFVTLAIAYVTRRGG